MGSKGKRRVKKTKLKHRQRNVGKKHKKMPNRKYKIGNSLVSSGKDSVLSLQRTQVQSVFGELRPHKLRCMAKKKKRKRKEKNNKT